MAFIEDEAVIRKILKHLDFWDAKRKPPPRANASLAMASQHTMNRLHQALMIASSTYSILLWSIFDPARPGGVCANGLISGHFLCR